MISTYLYEMEGGMDADQDALRKLERQVAELQDELTTLKSQLAPVTSTPLSHQESDTVSSQKKKWRMDLSVIIALGALLFSFGTTIYSTRQEERQRIRDARIELRGLVQRLSELPKENLEMTQTYTDALVIGQLSGLYQQENALLARQADEIISTIPDLVSSSEYIMVANAMFNSNLMDESIRLLERAEAVIRDYNDGVAIYRFKGNLYFLAGAFENGREEYQKALEIFEDFPSPSSFYEASTHALTYVYWSQAEAGQGLCQQAEDLLENAKEYVIQLSVEGHPSLVELQIEQTQQYLDICD